MIEELSKAQAKAQAKAKHLPLMATPVASKADKITELFEKYMSAQEARAAVPQAAPAPAAQPIIVTAPWGPPAAAPAAPAPAPAPAPLPSNLYDMMSPNPYDMMSTQDPFENADLMAMLAVSGVDAVPAVGGVAKPSPASPAAAPMVNPFPSCGC